MIHNIPEMFDKTYNILVLVGTAEAPHVPDRVSVGWMRKQAGVQNS
jgi:hypothetical protein